MESGYSWSIQPRSVTVGCGHVHVDQREHYIGLDSYHHSLTFIFPEIIHPHEIRTSPRTLFSIRYGMFAMGTPFKNHHEI
jgi:hypothetical protein